IVWRDAAAFVVGLLIVLLGGAGVMMALGAWDALLESARVTSQYTAISLNWTDFSEALRVTMGYRWAHWGLLFVLAAVGILITRASQRGKVLLLWLNAGSVIMLAQAKIYDYHWLPMLPPLVILGGIAIERVLERVMHSPPHPPAPSPTQAGRRGAITRALSLSPFMWERDGLPKRSDASRVRGNLDIKVHNTLLERGDVNRLLRFGVSILITVLLLAILVNGKIGRASCRERVWVV